jgi:NADH:ubiquinone oxidoreductase subunit 4 (subunit M)
MLQRVNLGTTPEKWQETSFRDIITVEWLAWTPLLAGILLLGLFPRIVFGVTDNAVAGVLHVFGV